MLSFIVWFEISLGVGVPLNALTMYKFMSLFSPSFLRPLISFTVERHETAFRKPGREFILLHFSL